MKAIINLAWSTIAVLVTASLLPGVDLDNWFTALLVAIVIAGLNIFVKPILVVLTIPVTILTLGLFLLVINALLIMLAGWIVPGFAVSGFLSALAFSLVMSLIHWVFNTLQDERSKLAV